MNPGVPDLGHQYHQCHLNSRHGNKSAGGKDPRRSAPATGGVKKYGYKKEAGDHDYP